MILSPPSARPGTMPKPNYRGAGQIGIRPQRRHGHGLRRMSFALLFPYIFPLMAIPFMDFGRTFR